MLPFPKIKVAISRKRAEVMAVCHKCGEIIYLEAVIRGKQIIELESHRRIIRQSGIPMHHICGGSVTIHVVSINS